MQQQLTYLTYSILALMVAVSILAVIQIVTEFLQERLNAVQNDFNEHQLMVNEEVVVMLEVLNKAINDGTTQEEENIR